MTTSHEPDAPPPGWYTDPHGPGQRWWDGERWTEHVSDVAFVLHPPAAYEPNHPAQAAPPAPPALERPRPPSPPPIFWALPVLVVVMIAGAAGTWLSIGAAGQANSTFSGLEDGGDGWLVVLAALIAAIVLAAWVFERVILLPVVAGVTGLAASAMALYHVVEPAAGYAVSSDLDASAGWGVWVALAGSLALVGVSVALARVGP